MDKTSTDIRYAQPATRELPNPSDVRRWASVAGIYLLGAAMIVLAIVNYRTLEETLRRDAELNRQQREFNEGLVAAIEDLADKSGILTSSDYCPVRFRLRFPGGAVPANQMLAKLTRLSSGGEEQVGQRSSTVSGLIEFGLHAPGSYRFQVCSSDGMWLAHEFDLLPGVPVDRVVICPKAASPAGVEVDVNWPAELASEDFVALIEILPGPFETGDWRWEPKRDAPPLYTVATTGGDTERLFERLDREHLDSVLQSTGLPVADVSGEVQVPYRYCRIGSITFLHLVRDSRFRDQLRLLGTLHFGSGGLAASSVGRHWEAAGPPPLVEANPDHASHWNVDVPRECIDELLQRIQETAR